MSETSTGSRPDADQAEPGPVVYLLCGLTGSGKTTFAQRMQAEGVVRLSVDEEVSPVMAAMGLTIRRTGTSTLSAPLSRKYASGWWRSTVAVGGCCTSS